MGGVLQGVSLVPGLLHWPSVLESIHRVAGIRISPRFKTDTSVRSWTAGVHPSVRPSVRLSWTWHCFPLSAAVSWAEQRSLLCQAEEKVESGWEGRCGAAQRLTTRRPESHGDQKDETGAGATQERILSSNKGRRLDPELLFPRRTVEIMPVTRKSIPKAAAAPNYAILRL